jgi:hypothetical protein
MLGNRLVDDAEGGGGGGDSVHRGRAAELKDQLPLGDGLRLGEEGLPLPLVADGVKQSAVVGADFVGRALVGCGAGC